MSKGIPILVLVMSSFLGYSFFAGVQGHGIRQPKKEQLSVREGSRKSKTSRKRTGGYYSRRRRGFTGGGLFGGK